MDRVQIGILLRQYHHSLSLALSNLRQALPEEAGEEVANPIIADGPPWITYSCLDELRVLKDRLEADIATLLGEENRTIISSISQQDYAKRFLND